MKNTYLLAMAGLLGVSQAYGNELCVQPWNSSCYQTIQAAVDAASPGDLIFVFPHPDSRGYRENVTVNKANLTIAGVYVDGGPTLQALTGLKPAELSQAVETLGQGEGKEGKEKGGEAPSCPAQILSTCETTAFPTSCDGDGFTIDADGVTIRNMTIRHADDAVFIDDQDDATLNNLCVIESDDGVDGTGSNDDLRVTNSAFLGLRNTGIDPNGDRMRVLNNFIRNAQDDGIDITSNEAIVAHNVVKTADDDCIDVEGDRVLIAHNRINGCDSEGIEYTGTESKIRENEVLNVMDDDEGINLEGDENTVANNYIDRATEEGIEIDGNRNRVHHNRVERSGDNDAEGAIDISGDDNRIWSNVAWKNARAGFRNQDGNRNHYEDNLSSENGKSGIRVTDGDDTVVIRNAFLNNEGEGINVDTDAANTVVRFNKSFGNYRDICNDSATTTFDSNAFKTGGAGTACVVEQ